MYLNLYVRTDEFLYSCIYACVYLVRIGGHIYECECMHLHVACTCVFMYACFYARSVVCALSCVHLCQNLGMYVSNHHSSWRLLPYAAPASKMA